MAKNLYALVLLSLVRYQLVSYCAVLLIIKERISDNRYTLVFT